MVITIAKKVDFKTKKIYQKPRETFNDYNRLNSSRRYNNPKSVCAKYK